MSRDTVGRRAPIDKPKAEQNGQNAQPSRALVYPEPKDVTAAQLALELGCEECTVLKDINRFCREKSKSFAGKIWINTRDFWDSIPYRGPNGKEEGEAG